MKRVLIVEDCPITSELVEVLVALLGARATRVSDGASALGRLSSDRFDVVLVDMQLPGMDGFMTARKMREMGYEGLLVGMSARGMPSDPREAIEAGCDRFVDKAELKHSLPDVLRPALTAISCS